MPMFRKRPVIVEAVTFDPKVPESEWPDGVFAERYSTGDGGIKIRFCVVSAQGRLKVEPGDWIVYDLGGNHYPCKADVFAQTFEPVLEVPGGGY